MINKNINTNHCLTKTSVNDQNKLSCSLRQVFQNLFPSIKCNCTTTKEIENITISFESSTYFGYDEVPIKILKLCSHFISSPINYICNRNLFTGVFPNRLKYAIIRPLFKKGNKNDLFSYKPVSVLTLFSKCLKK